jgi:hypothetical protein
LLWGPRRDRAQWPTGSLAQVRGVSCPVPGCWGGSGVGPGDRGVGAAGERQDGLAAVLATIGAALTDRVACVAVGRDERDPQRFWLSVLQTYVPERMATDPVGWVVR